jgi:hypothetical protein
MKNSFKFGFLALAISLSVVACNSNKASKNAADSVDSTTEVKTDSIDSSSDAKIDKLDSTSKVKVDSLKK